MYRALVIGALMSATLGGVVAMQSDIPAERSFQTHRMQPAGTTPGTGDNSGPVYAGSQQKHFYYPTYPEYSPDTGYPIQTGYEEYRSTQPSSSSFSDWISSLVPVAKYALLQRLRQVGIHLLQIFIHLLIGTAFATALCTFTPVCTISFLGSDLPGNKVKDQFFKWTRNFNTEAIVGSALQKAVKEVVEHESSTIQAETDKPKDEKETRKQTVRRRRR